MNIFIEIIEVTLHRKSKTPIYRCSGKFNPK